MAKTPTKEKQPETKDAEVDVFGNAKLVDPNGPVGYIWGPTPYVENHEANQTTRGKKP
jgi:hypothetical protein